MTKLKRWLVLLTFLILCLILAIVGCNNKDFDTSDLDDNFISGGNQLPSGDNNNLDKDSEEKPPIEEKPSIGDIIQEEISSITLLTDGQGTVTGISTIGKLLNKVTIPSTLGNEDIIAIGPSAFAERDFLEIIELPSTIKSIGEKAFFGCSKLTNIQIPNHVTDIKDSAFSNCTSLTSVHIPSSVTYIGKNAFYGCDNITSCIMPTIAIDFIPKTRLQKVKINSGNEIEPYAFYYSTSLMSIVLSKSISRIGANAFMGCAELSSVLFEDNSRLTDIGYRAFSNCNNLNNIEFGNNSILTSIGKESFQYCTSLTKI